ncbi:VCBS repeat-containing protein [Bacillus sp. H1a]|uniref:FG-GAP repeat domain-containing protein n=1 Tax=Bacillus sp. H1a TaxID=1397276 RepID=UPI00046A908A|nr:VCBS repeat-containing protein [Bacillus sp. H1a]
MYGWPVRNWVYTGNRTPFECMPPNHFLKPLTQPYNLWPVNGVMETIGLHFPESTEYKRYFDNRIMSTRKKWPSFDVKQYAVGGNLANDITAADFDGDGNLDLAVTNLGSDNVSILLGNGNGSFAPPMNFPAGSRPAGIVSADFNGDGIIDLAIINDIEQSGPSGPEPGTVSILIGIGNGIFQAPISYTLQFEPTFVIVSDFNRDGKLDLAVTNSHSESISILLGNGDGTFKPAVNYSVLQPPYTQATPFTIAAADFNGDGLIDLAVANNTSSNIAILLGNGDGTFKPPMYMVADYGLIGIVAADFNRDGIVDIAVASNVSDKVSIYLGNGDGTFKPAGSYQRGIETQMLVAADLNGDGIIDLAATNTDSNSISVLIGNGDGTFEVANNIHAGMTPEVIIAHDFNNDGRIDLAVTNFNSDNNGKPLGTGYVSILLSKNC